METLKPEKKELLLDEIIEKPDKDFIYNYLDLIKEKYGLREKKIKIIISDSGEEFLPSSIFSGNLGIAETIIKYLRENLLFSNKEISALLKKSQNNIAVAYNKTKRKYPFKFSNLKFTDKIPFIILENTKLTTFEAVVLYYKDKIGLSFHKIAVILMIDFKSFLYIQM